MARPAPSTLLRRLEARRLEYGAGAAAKKLALIEALARRRLTSAEQVRRLHEVLCFLRAYPDDRQVLDAVEGALARFDRRADLRRHAPALADTGIAGTSIWFPFFWVTAEWLAARWPDRLGVDWEAFDARDRLVGLLSLLLPYAESLALDSLALEPHEWIARLKGPDETDATFLIRRFATLRTDTFGLEKSYESLDVPILLEPGPDTPSRTRAQWPVRRVHYQRGPLVRDRPDLREAIARPPRGVRALGPAAARRLLDTVRAAMVVRHRDLDAFAYADPRDVRIVDCGDGLEFACCGQLPERRLLLESVYGFLTLKNGVPIGYVLASSFFGSTEVAYNVFETWRGAEAGPVFGRVLAMIRQLFGTTAFAIDPYQLGHQNQEGLESGAWWFYYKLGFRPKNPHVKRLLRDELRAMRRDARHRTDVETLNELSSDYMFWFPDGERDDVMGLVALDRIGAAVSAFLARNFGAERERGIEECSREAEALLGVRTARWSSDERLAWGRWSPLVAVLPGVRRWPARDRRALADVIRAKGGRRESEFVRRANAHPRLYRALVRLTR